ncbi:MAG TPA: hypothetical protein VFI33_03600 [Puia sp.]|nr:hypothetical protein [Puia sp.]
MKNFLAGLGCLFIFSFGFGQGAVHFTMGLLPNNSYDQSVNQKIRIELNLDSSTADMIEKMEANGVKNPTVQEQEINMEAVTVSGSLNKQTGRIPVTMSIIKSDGNLASMLTPETKFLGSTRLNEMPVYDSISGITLQENQKQQILKAMSSLSQINLPNKSLVPGQSDTLHTPISIPVGSIVMKMDYITIYHLKSIREKTALFDVDANFVLNMEVKDLPMSGYGSGSGSMEYDMEKHYPVVYKLKYKIIMRIAREGLILHMNMFSDLSSLSTVHSL